MAGRITRFAHVELVFQEGVVTRADEARAHSLSFLDVCVWTYLHMEQFVSGLGDDNRIPLLLESVAQ